MNTANDVIPGFDAPKREVFAARASIPVNTSAAARASPRGEEGLNDAPQRGGDTGRGDRLGCGDGHADLVIAIGTPALIISSRQADTAATPAASRPIVTEAGGVVTAAGVRFPLPDGWTARAVQQTAVVVTVCVAQAPSRDCAGVTVRIAIPNAQGRITPVPDALSLEDPVRSAAQTAPESDSVLHTSSVADTGAPTTVTSMATPATSAASTAGGYDGQPGDASGVSTSSAGIPAGSSEAPVAPHDLADALCPMLEDANPVGGRPAEHLMIGSCAPGSPQSASWYVADGSLSISTPRGVAAAQAAQIAAGIDFSGYAHAFGPQIAYLTSAEPAPSPSLATAPFPTSTVTVPPESSGAPATATTSVGSPVGGAGATSTTTATPAA